MRNETKCEVPAGQCPFPQFGCEGCRYPGRYKRINKNDPDEIARNIDKCLQRERDVVESFTNQKP